MKKYIAVAVVTSLLIACAGRTPYPVPVYQPTDPSLNCDEITTEIINNQQRVYSLYPKTQKTGKNVALGVAGAFFLVPLFFMDFSDAERIEIEAYQRRDQHLQRLAASKKCQHTPPAMKLLTEPAQIGRKH